MFAEFDAPEIIIFVGKPDEFGIILFSVKKFWSLTNILLPLWNTIAYFPFPSGFVPSTNTWSAPVWSNQFALAIRPLTPTGSSASK